MESVLLESINIKNFLDALSHIEDERDNRGKRHHLSFVITGIILAYIVWSIKDFKYSSFY